MTTTMAWILLVIAGVLEFIWATGLKQSEGFTRLWPSIFTLVVMGISFYLLALAMRVLPIGVSYTVWTGIGAVGSVLVGYFIFHESMSLMKFCCLVLIVGGILGLKFSEA